ncbi:putative AAA+ ATPase domain-containing protein [Seiridium cardinale]|uniref:AAA+ ATPase domain-containing protein n=1 Tax=Seiridium cardinale TaxID=138064 RepID=A0ABR2XT93_9PEZI
MPGTQSVATTESDAGKSPASPEVKAPSEPTQSGTNELPGAANADPPGNSKRNVHGKNKKEKKTSRRKSKHNTESSTESSRDDESDTVSTASSSNGSLGYVRYGDGPMYQENPLDVYHRRLDDKRRGKRGRRRRRKVDRKVHSRSSSLDSYHSELFDIEQFEKTNGTSRAVRKLWGAVQELRDRLSRVESSSSSSESETNSDEDEKNKKRKKGKARRGAGASAKKVAIVESAAEDQITQDNITPNITDSSALSRAGDSNTANAEAQVNDMAGTELSGKQEEIGVKEGKPIEEEEAKTAASDNKALGAKHGSEKASDGGDEASDDGSEDSEKENASREFELKAQFFYRNDEEQRSLFHSEEIYPLIRVRWDDLNPNEVETIQPSSDKTGEFTPSRADLIEISIESPAFVQFIKKYAYDLTHTPQSAPPPPPPLWATAKPDQTMSFYKPFRWLIQNRDVFQGKVKSLEDEQRAATKAHSNEGSATPTLETKPPSQPSGLENKATTTKSSKESLDNNLLEQLKFILGFMDEHLTDTIRKYEDARTGKLKSIFYEDLWMLYKPGDIIYTPLRRAAATSFPPPPPPPHQPYRPAKNTPPTPNILIQGFGRDTPQAYKIIAITGGRMFATATTVTPRKVNTYTQLKLLCYFIDSNGYRFDCMADTFTFKPFDNEISITDLEAYPIAYASLGEARGEKPMLEFLKSRGKSFIEVCEASHKLYEGLAYNYEGNKEEINTPVIVDFALAYANMPGLRPQMYLPHVDFFNQARNQRSELREITLAPRIGKTIDWYWQHQINLIGKSRSTLGETLDRYPSVGSDPSEPAIPKLISAMEENGHILLLPGMVHAFALRNRKWVSLDLTLVQDAQYEDGWKDLILPPGHKEMVRAVVENHATGSRATVGMTKRTAEVDIVRGKGKGCIILLHGEPGVGKTSTAECVAAFTKRPLFPITCGDIGYEPDEVERNMEKHFNLAHKWGCVMLLDEADVFLAKRSREDIKRNGLVSVFLRILEYYPGILFLTTNRVGSFDDAFRSRLHLTLYYPKLDRKQTIQIFEMNLRRVMELNAKREEVGHKKSLEIQGEKIIKFAKRNWETLSWNGRQIRNAFQTAIALAEFDIREESETKAVMSKKQFKTIAKASMEFDDYLFHTHGGTDESANARREQVRWDYEVKGRPGKKRDLADSSSEDTSESSSSSSDSSDASDDSDYDSSSSDSDRAKRGKKKKGKSKKDKKAKKSDSKGKKSKSKKDKHT